MKSSMVGIYRDRGIFKELAWNFVLSCGPIAIFQREHQPYRRPLRIGHELHFFWTVADGLATADNDIATSCRRVDGDTYERSE